MFDLDQLEETEGQAEFHAIHLLLADHVILTVVVDGETGAIALTRIDLVEEAEPETAYRIAAESVEAVSEGQAEVFSSEGVDARPGIRATVEAIALMAASADNRTASDPLATHTGGLEMRPHFHL